MERKQLSDLIYSFWHAIIQAREDGKLNKMKYLGFANFPDGCCGMASEFLSQYLLDNGYYTNVVTGSFYDEEGGYFRDHVWLTYNDCVIDITGNQFKNHNVLRFSKPVYYGPESKMHKCFSERRSISEPGIKDRDDVKMNSTFRELYELICSYL